MALANTTTCITVVPDTEKLLPAESSIKHNRFLFVGESSLQMKMLMSLISGKFGFSAGISSASALDTVELNAKAEVLVVLDCLSVRPEQILQLQDDLDAERLPGIVLINASKDTPIEELAEWNQVVAVLHNNTSPELVLAGFDQILKGGMWLPRKVMESLILKGCRQQKSRRSKPIPVKLTRRETQILEKLSEGTSNTKIADSLFLSEHTVKTHLYNIYKKVNVSNRTQACNWLKEYRPD